MLGWVYYYNAIIFERIILVPNDCTDSTGDLLVALEKNGEVIHIAHTVPEGPTPQGTSVKVISRKYWPETACQRIVSCPLERPSRLLGAAERNDQTFLGRQSEVTRAEHKLTSGVD